MKDKITIVTGGLGHIGASISEGLAESGAMVYSVSIGKKNCHNLELTTSKYKDRIKHLPMDMRFRKSIDKTFQRIFKKHGRIDVLVNNAYFGAAGKLEEISEKNWTEGIEGTINSVFRCTQAVIPYMKKAQAGSIINISSMYALVSPIPSVYGNSGLDNPPNYGAGKAAIIQFTRYAACYLAHYGIRVNSISPGPFPNEEVQHDVDFISRLAERVPLGRIGKPSELKGVIILLASDASSYITGANISIDGGWTAW
jgi:gluconate 5-dehydrogenase